MPTGIFIRCGVKGCKKGVYDTSKFCSTHESMPQEDNSTLCGKCIKNYVAIVDKIVPDVIKEKTLGRPKINKKKGSVECGFQKLVQRKEFLKNLPSRFTATDANKAAEKYLKKKFPDTTGRVNPIDGTTYDPVRWEAQIRQAYKILSCSSREAVYVSGKLRTTYLDMVEGKLKPLFYCQELHDENLVNNFNGEYSRGVRWMWQKIDSSTPKKYTTPLDKTVAQSYLIERKKGNRGTKKEGSSKVIHTWNEVF